MQSMRETAANAGASIKAGMEKTKASVQEKVDKMKSRDPIEKEMARERKEDRMETAEERKQEAQGQNAAARHAGGGFTSSGYDRGDPRDFAAGDVNRGYQHNAPFTGYDARGGNVGYTDNTGERTGGYAYSTTGRQDYRTGEFNTRNPTNAGTGRNLNARVADDEPY